MRFILIMVMGSMLASSARAVQIDLERPGPREFVRDLAGLIDADSQQKIQTIGNQLLTDQATPIIVVTIDSMAKHGGADLRIETFARLLFDQWEIGHAKLPDGQPWNTGILLLVSKGDRKARIELGAGWKRDKDVVCQRIMDQIIIPHFKQGRFSEGIVDGVTALDQMVRQGLTAASPAPTTVTAERPANSVWPALIGIGVVALLVFTVVSLLRSGAGGWGWLLWAAVFGLLGYALYEMLRPRHDSWHGGGFSGGFSGGSFGGGFSGGGGASGSW